VIVDYSVTYIVVLCTHVVREVRGPSKSLDSVHRMTHERNLGLLVLLEQPVCSKLHGVQRQVGHHVRDRSCIAQFVLHHRVSIEVHLGHLNFILGDIESNRRTCALHAVGQIFWEERLSPLRNNCQLAFLVRTFETVPIDAATQPARTCRNKSLSRIAYCRL
jgi:hypothetical protein